MFDAARDRGSGSGDGGGTAEPESPPTPMELLRDPDNSVTGEPYHEQFIDAENEVVDGEEVRATVRDTTDSDDDTDSVVGAWGRELIETHALSDDEPIWLGWMTQNQRLVKAGIKISHLARHMWLPGKSGAGKSTLFEIIKMQLAYRGLGFVDFDPKGPDSKQLLAKIPEFRRDDVVVVDPIGDYGKTVGINFLQIPEHIIEAGENAVEREIVSRKENNRAFFEGDDYWGVNMKLITDVLGEAMMRANVDLIRRGGDPSEQYTFIDFFTLVLNATTRENFAEEVDDPFLRAAVGRVSSMDDEQTMPTLKRIIPWVLNHITRKIIAHRESTIDFKDIIENDKIVIVRTAIDNPDIRQMITLGVMRMLWSAVQRRAQTASGTPKPYFVFADEFNDIASEQLDMERMFSNARSMNLGVFVAHQYADQLKESFPETYRAVSNNAETLTAFRSLEEANAKEIMGRFPGYDADDLLETDDYEIWCKIALGGGDTTQPLKLNTFAPYPKLRSMDAVDAFIEERLDETGVEPLTTREIIQQMPYDDPYGLLGAAVDGSVTSAEDATRLQESHVKRDVTRAIFHEGISRGVTNGAEQEPDGPGHDEWWIDVDRALYERADRYVFGGLDTETELSTILDEMAGSQIRKRQSDGRQVTVSDAGRAALFTQGSSMTGGKGDHTDLGEDSTIALIRLGLEAEVVEQTGGRDVDGVVRIRELRDTDCPEGVSQGARGRVERRRYEHLSEEYPLLTWLTDGADCTVEYEKSTAGRKSLINWIKAFNAGERCLFTAREDAASKVYNAVSEPTALKSVEDVSDGRIRYYYNHTRKLRVGDETVVFEDASTVQWSYDERDEQYLATDGSGSIRARFDSYEEIFSNRSKYDGIESEYDDVELGEHGPHLRVNAPILPEREFNIETMGDLDHEQDTRVLIVPENLATDERPITDIISAYTEDGVKTLAEIEQELCGVSTDSSTDPDSSSDDEFGSFLVGDGS